MEIKPFLLESLEIERDHVVGILEGLSDEQLRRKDLPSGWNCLGMVNHLALRVEHYWLRCIVAGESLDFFTSDALGDNGEWDVGPGVTGEEIIERYRAEVAHANVIILETPLDAMPRQLDPAWGSWEVPNFLFIMMHMIKETATHAGHLDVVRELIDARQWTVL
jgi:hypothetical protein